MRRLKKVAAIVSLAMVISMGADVALGGAIETPGNSVPVTADAPGATVTGVIETPGFNDIILFAVTLIM